MLGFFNFQQLSLTCPLVKVTSTLVSTKVLCSPSDDLLLNLLNTGMYLRPCPIVTRGHRALITRVSSSFCGFSMMDRELLLNTTTWLRKNTQWPNQNSKVKSCFKPAHSPVGQGITERYLKMCFFLFCF